MHWLGTCTALSFNRRHERSGHVYQGRFGSKVVEDDAYLLELARYLPRNPVQAGLCSSPEGWVWSSYAATAGLLTAPWFLDPGLVIRALGPATAYAEWVAGEVDATVLDQRGFRIPVPPPRLSSLLNDGSQSAIRCAHSHGYTQAAIADYLGVNQTQVSRSLAGGREV